MAMSEPVKDNQLKLLAPPAENDGENEKGRADFYIEIALIFVLGILIGIAVKTEAVKRITMGYNDYQIKIEDDRYSISQLEKDLISKQSKETESQPVIPESSSNNDNNQ